MIKIESTESGEVFNIKIEQSIESVKYQLSLLTSITPQEQIILFGPPFKILDSQVLLYNFVVQVVFIIYIFYLLSH